ncbi:MAG: hypothetical protein GY730_06610, partial [bacterium]|nr:hypothetical protein [bacterium]
MSIYPKELSLFDDFCPILALWPNFKTTVTKGGKYVRVIELTGKDYAGLAPEIIESFYELRKGFFESLDSEISVLQQSHRMKVTRVVKENEFKNKIAGQIGNIWSEQFK